MKIAVNLLPFKKELAGAGRYAKCLLQQLALIDKSNHYLLFVTPENKVNFAELGTQFQYIICPPINYLARIAWEQFILPFQLKYYQVDLLFTPSVAMPLASPCKNVTSIFDMMFFHNQQLKKYTPLRAFYGRMVTRIACRRSHIILTISEHSRHDILTICQLPAPKVKAILLAAGHEFQPLTDKTILQKCQQKYHLPDKFILYVGTLEPGKNLVNLIKAFQQFKKLHHFPHKLVLAGGWGWQTQEIKAAIADFQSEIILTGFMPDEDLPALYNLADIFVYPSLYEGFGLPVLEAMACGTPVITSNVSSLPEIAGEAGLLVNPANIEQIADSLAAILHDETLKLQLSQKGIAQAAQFSWESTARQTLAALNSLS